MEYCNRCILPDTRPGLVIDEEGVCSACRNFELRASIDWAGREEAFRELARAARQRSEGYDCLIPVSGGKDSTWQTVKCLEAGLHPLAVTWRPPARTPIGQRNLDNLVELGVDHIDYRINPDVERRFTLEALRRFGSTAIPMHMAIFNIPLEIAVAYRIPLVVWGENSAFEYGDPGEERLGFKLDASWLRKHGVTHGTTAEDWVGPLTRQELTPYRGPDPDALEAHGVLAVFLGYYFSWDVEETRAVAQAHGFSSEAGGARTGIYDFADIDDEFISIHHYLKWLKFGFTRAFDNLSLEIRHGRLTREEAVRELTRHGEQFPRKDVERFCAWVGIGFDEFLGIIEGFRNLDLWVREDGVWTLPGFLVADWDWSDREIR